MALMIPVARVLYNSKNLNIFGDEPKGGQLGRTISNKWLSNRYKNGSNQHIMIAIIYEAKSQQTNRIQNRANSKTDSKSFRIHEMACGEINYRIY